MKQSDKTKLASVIAIIAIVLCLNQMGYLGTKLNLSTQPTPSTTTTQPGVVSGILTSSVTAYDSLDTSQTRTVGTDIKVYWYAYRNGWVLLGTGNAADLSILKDDNNIIYMVVQGVSGYYVDYQKIMSMNSRIQSVEYKDITGDSVKEFVFRVSIADAPYASGTGKYLMPGMTVFALTVDASYSVPSGGQPADISSIGTTKVTKYLQWYAAISAAKKGVAVAKVVLIANTSDISKLSLSTLNIPGIGNLPGSSFEQDVQTTQTKWTYKISNEFYGADYLTYPANSLNKQDFTAAIQFTLASGNKINLTLYVYYLDGSESMQSINDAVLCSA